MIHSSFKIASGPDHSFSFVIEKQLRFEQLHHHPQFELNLVIKGNGTRIIGNSIEHFSDGDLVLLGPSLPHTRRHKEKHSDVDMDIACRSCTILFDYDFLGVNFFDRPEFRKIKLVLLRSSVGLKLVGKLRDEISTLMEAMEAQCPTERLITLLDILRLISISSDVETLSSQIVLSAHDLHNDERIKKVRHYIETNFKNVIKLEDVAQTANMTPTAFSRYFRKKTQKTFSNYLTEVRIRYACRLLLERRTKIVQVCYESGYSNLSNFNKQFKAVTLLTPLEYTRVFVSLSN